MKPIQAILALSLGLMALIYFARLRKKSYDRIIVLLFLLLGAVLVFVPDWTTAIANYLGVGRGADLLLYLGLVGLSFVCLLLYSRLRDQEAKLTELARRMALLEARRPGEQLEETEQVTPESEM